MRLGQFAKKYDIPVREIITYLEEETGEKFHPNAKLYDTLESKVFEYFELQPETSEIKHVEVLDKETIEELEVTERKPEADEQPLPATPEEEIALLEGDLAELNEAEKQSVEVPLAEEIEREVETPKPSGDEVIQTDKLLELLDSEEPPAGLDKIKLIKAPKKELSGLKVVGKVDLPEPKKKEEKSSDIVTEKDLREYRNPRKKRQPLTEEEREKRRLKAKRKKEAYEAQVEKRKKERAEQEQKARKEKHYQQKLEQAKAAKIKQQTKQKPTQIQKNEEEKRPQPKTMLGKFWRWMNT